ncbi:MAG: tRNA (cytidine(56)-2'-O)-methyltransferase [Candidatus Micrarchaeota archaeon]|nr:tRNA (cytidine(56)-2'-O)-methyltransferase [Candidatus Micrarchaeota archaeon]
MAVCILRLGHRAIRDQRLTTHVFLAARALGGDEGALCGDFDQKVLASIKNVCGLWGGDFQIRHVESWKKFILERKKAGWAIVHLTMYGEPFEGAMAELFGKNVVVVVGAGKVPAEIYRLSDYNLAVSNQPHSEVSALALFLDRYHKGEELGKRFEGKMRIIPNKCGKSVIRVKNR